MVRWPASSDAAAYARTRRALSVGLHVDLGEWIWSDGAWRALYARVDLLDADAVDREVHRQLETCCDLLGQRPTHLDSHQHVHRREPLRSIVSRVAAELRVPVRHDGAIRYCGDFYGQDWSGGPLPHLITVSSAIALLHALPEGITEMACHPGYADDLESMYRVERAIELRTLCAHRVHRFLDDGAIHLISFADVVGV